MAAINETTRRRPAAAPLWSASAGRVALAIPGGAATGTALFWLLTMAVYLTGNRND